MTIPTTIKNLIDSHKNDAIRLNKERKLPQIKVSKAVSFLAVLYEQVRNSVDYEEEHLLRKRAIKRILIRLKALEKGKVKKLAADTATEIILAQYMNEYPTPTNKLPLIENTLKKYRHLLRRFYEIHQHRLYGDNKDLIYSFCAFEIERLLVPYSAKDALVNAQFHFLKDKSILSHPNLDKERELIQLYIACYRANIKSDDEMIAYRLFTGKFKFWAKPTEEQLDLVARNLVPEIKKIQGFLSFKIKKTRFKEIIRQSIPFQILDQLIKNNLSASEEILTNSKRLEGEIRVICSQEYERNRKVLNTTIVRTMIYIFITKILLAVVIEVPYEIMAHGQINFLTLGINIVFPAIAMYIISTSFSIPNEKNTKEIISMINAIISTETKDAKATYSHSREISAPVKFIFRFIYFSLFVLIFSGIIYLLTLLNFSLPGIAIFIIFFCTICFAAVKIRNTAAELKVVETRPSVFSPLVDMISAPILFVGKKLSEGAKDMNVFIIVLDFLIEAPFKNIIKVIEDWSNYIRETREEII